MEFIRDEKSERETIVGQRGKYFMLEDRTVFDASLPLLFDALDHVAIEPSYIPSDSVPAVDATVEKTTVDASVIGLAAADLSVPAPSEIAFVDSSLPDIAQLLAGLGPNVEIYTVDTGINGFEYMADILRYRTDISAIHILGHGEAAEIYLGNAVLDAQTIGLATSTLQTIGGALTANGDILIYGCDVAADPAGQDFIRQISQITSADIAASTDATGAQNQGGDWDLEFKTGDIEARMALALDWDHIMHTDSVGFLLTPGSAAGTYNVEVFFGSWHSGGIAPLGRAILYTMDPGGSATNPANFNQVAYGDNYNLTGSNEFIFSRTTSLTGSGLNYENGSHVYTKAEIDAAGFSTGVNYFWANSAGKLIDTNVGAYSNIYNHQSTVISNVGPGTYRLDYEFPKPTDATWAPVSGVDKVIFTISASGQLTVAGAGSPVSLSAVEDITSSILRTDFSNSFSGTLGDVKITQLPTNGQILVNGTAITAVNTVISAADLNNNLVTFRAAADWNGADTFKWSGYDTAAQKWSAAADGNITVAPVNDAPSLSLTAGTGVSFTEGTNTSGVSLFSGASVSTYEAGQTVKSITLTVDNISNGSDERLIIEGSEFALLNGETGIAPQYTYAVSNSGTTSTITLSGMALTATQAQHLIESIKYNNTSIDPTVAGGRTIAVTRIQDSGGTANNGIDAATYSGPSATVTLTAVNSAPTVTSLVTNATYYENTDAAQGYGSVSVFKNASVSGGEASDTIKGMTLTVTNSEASDYLMIDGTAVPLANNATATTGNVVVTVTVVNGTATIALTEVSGGSLTAQEASNILNNLKFYSTSENPSSTQRDVSVTSVTDSGNLSATPTIVSHISVTPINDPAVVTVGSGDYVTAKSTSLPNADYLLTGLGVSDADGATVTVVLSLSKDSSSAAYGSLTLNSAALTPFVNNGNSFSGNGSDTVTLSGNVNDINTLLAAAPTYKALQGQDVVADGPNKLTITVTDSNGAITVVTKDITVLPAPPNSQSLVAMGTEDTTLFSIPDLSTKVDIAGSAVAAPGYYTFGTGGVVDQSVEFVGTGTITYNTFTGGSAGTIEVWVVDSSVSPVPKLLVEGAGQDYTLDTTNGTITFATAKAATDSILVKTTNGTITTGTAVTDSVTSAVGLDLGNGRLFLAANERFVGDGTTTSFANAVFTGVASVNLTATVVDANGAATVLTITASAPSSATEVQYDGTNWTLQSGLQTGSTLIIGSNIPTGNITANGLNGSTVFIPNADFYGTDAFYYQYNSVRTTTAVADGSITDFLVSSSDGSVKGAVVTLGGVTMTEGTDYLVDVSLNKISFQVAPTSGQAVTIETVVKSPVSQGLIYIAGVNDAPTVTVPAPFLQLQEDLANQNIGTGITFVDVSNEMTTGALYEARLTVTNGALDYTATDGDASGGSDVVLVDGAVGSGFLVLRGTAADLRATLATLNFTPNADYFTAATSALGDASTTTFAIGANVNASGDVYVYLNKVLQTTSYTVDTSANTVTFTTAPAAGDTIELVLVSAADTLNVTINDIGNTGSGGALTSTAAVKLVVTNVNDAPTVTASSLNTTFTEKGLPSFIFDNTRINLGETADRVKSFVFTMSNLSDGTNERLILGGTEIQLVNGASGTTGSTYGVSYSVSLVNGLATVSVSKAGGLTVAQTEALIDEIRYLNTSSNPTDANPGRVASITQLVDTGGTVNSGVDTTASLSISSSMGIQGINSAPVITAITTGMTVMHMEDSNASSIFSGVTIDTIEANQNIRDLSFKVANVTDAGKEYITVDGQEFLLDSSVASVVTTANNFTVTISAVTVAGKTTATITVQGDTTVSPAGVLTVQETQTLLQGIKYRNASQAPTNENDRVITLLSLRDDGGVASGGTDESFSPSLRSTGGAISRSIMVMGVNDAPFAVGTLNDQTMVIGDVYSVGTASVFNDVEGDGIVYTATGLPEGVSINPRTGLISGRPLTAGIFNITVTATDTNGAATQLHYKDTISSPNRVSNDSGPKAKPISNTGPLFEPDVTNKTAQNTISGRSEGLRNGNGNAQMAVLSEVASNGNFERTSFTTRSGSGGLAVGRPLPEVNLRSGATASLLVASDTFVAMMSNTARSVTISATMADGSALPSWIKFNADEQSFEITPPEGYTGEVDVVVRAVDSAGNQAATNTTIKVGESNAPEDDGAWLEQNTEKAERHASINWDSLEKALEASSQKPKYQKILALSRQLA